MEKKQLVFPGHHLSSGEEGEPGKNSYLENDEIYAAGVGEQIGLGGSMEVRTRKSAPVKPKVGQEVYCVIVKASQNNAIAECISVECIEGKEKSIPTNGVLSASSIRNEFVPDIRSEVKVGDIIRAKVQKETKTSLELGMFGQECGVVKAFCPKCRNAMDLKANIFICSCGWTERRKIPLSLRQKSQGEI